MAETAQSWAESARPVRPQVWDTDAVQAGEAFDYYRDGICASFMPLRPELDRGQRPRFRGVVKSYRLNDCVANAVNARSHEVARGRSEIAASVEDCYYLNIQLGGLCRISQRGETIVLRPGDLGVFRSGVPFVLDHSERASLNVMSLVVPTAVLDATCGGVLSEGPRLLSAHPVFGRLAADAAQTLAGAVGWVPEREARRLFDAVLALAGMAGADMAAPPPETRHEAQLHRVMRIIRARCAELGLSVEDCAAEAGLSARYVHQLLARDGQRFSGVLRQARLSLAAHLLRSPAQSHEPVATVALAAGFADASHFGRVFRAEYGMSPGARRRDAVT